MNLCLFPLPVGIYTQLKLGIINSTMHLFPACIHGLSKCSPDVQEHPPPPKKTTKKKTCFFFLMGFFFLEKPMPLQKWSSLLVTPHATRDIRTAVPTSCPQPKKVSFKYIWTQAFDSSQCTYQLPAVTVWIEPMADSVPLLARRSQC